MLGLIATIPIYAQKFTKAEFNTKKFGQPQYLGKEKSKAKSFSSKFQWGKICAFLKKKAL